MSLIVGGFETVVELDREEYTCLDRVKICVVSPDLASDGGGSGRPAAIGDDRRDCWLTVSTGEGSLDGYRLAESEPGSGVFMGTVSLAGTAGMEGKRNSGVPDRGRTGGSGPDDGMLACGPRDELNVSFESELASAATRTAPIRWHMADVRFSKPSYLPGEKITVRVADRDMSLDGDRQDVSQVRVWSHSDREGIPVPIRETSCDSGVFEGQFAAVGDRSLPDQLVLKASDRDVVMAEYVDDTLPPPYACNDSIVVTSAASITTKRKMSSPLARLVVDDMRIMNERTGGAPAAGDGAHVAIRIKNPEREIQFTAALQVSDLEGATLELQHQPLTARLNGHATHTFSWTPRRPGPCIVAVFLWKSMDDPIAYSPPACRSVLVLDQEADDSCPEGSYNDRRSRGSAVLDPEAGDSHPEGGEDGQAPAGGAGTGSSAGGGPAPDDRERGQADPSHGRELGRPDS